MMNNQVERGLHARLRAIYQRVQWIADEEARAAWVNGFAANGCYTDEKEKLLKRTEKILDKLFRQPP